MSSLGRTPSTQIHSNSNSPYHSSSPSVSTTTTQSVSHSAQPAASQPRILQPTLHKPQSALDSIHSHLSTITTHASNGWNDLTTRATKLVNQHQSFPNSGPTPVITPTPNLNQSNDSRNRDRLSYDSFQNVGLGEESQELRGNNAMESEAASGNVGDESSSSSHLNHLSNHQQSLNSTPSFQSEPVIWSGWLWIPNRLISSNASDANHQPQPQSSIKKGKTLCLILSYPTSGFHIYALEGDDLREVSCVRDLKDRDGGMVGRVLCATLIKGGEESLPNRDVKNGNEEKEEDKEKKEEKEVVNKGLGAVDLISTETSSLKSSSSKNKKKRKEKTNEDLIVGNNLNGNTATPESTDNETSSGDSSFTPLQSLKSSQDPEALKIDSIKDEESKLESLEFLTPHLLLVTAPNSISSGLVISRYSFLSNRIFHSQSLSSSSISSDLSLSATLKISSRFLVISQTSPPMIHILDSKTLKSIRTPLTDVSAIRSSNKPPTFDLKDRILAYASTNSNSTNQSSQTNPTSRNDFNIMAAPGSSLFSTPSSKVPSNVSQGEGQGRERSASESLGVGSYSPLSTSPYRYSNVPSSKSNGAYNNALNASETARKMGGNLVNGVKNLGLSDWSHGWRNPMSTTTTTTTSDSISTSAPNHQTQFGMTSNSSNKRGSIGNGSSPSKNSPILSPVNGTGAGSQPQACHIKLIDLAETSKSDSGNSTLLAFTPAPQASEGLGNPLSVVSLAPTASGAMLLLTADSAGRNLDVWEWRNSGKNGSGIRGSVWHRYRLHRGLTTSEITQITWSKSAQWIGLGTKKGTVHIFAINPFGGEADLMNHLTFGTCRRGPEKSMPLSVEVGAVVRTSRSNLGNGPRVERSASGGNDLSNQSQVEERNKGKSLGIPTFVMMEDFPSGENARLHGLGPPPISKENFNGSLNQEPKTIMDVLVFHPSNSTISLNRVVCSPNPAFVSSTDLSSTSKATSTSKAGNTSSSSIGKGRSSGFFPTSPERRSPNLASSNLNGSPHPSTTPSPPSRISGLTHMMRRASEGLTASAGAVAAGWTSSHATAGNGSSSNSNNTSTALISPSRASNLLAGSNSGQRIRGDCFQLATWGTLAREMKEVQEAETVGSIAQSSIESKSRLELLRNRELARKKKENPKEINWVSKAEITTFSKSKRLLPPSIYLSRQFNFHLFSNDGATLSEKSLASMQSLSTIKLEIREEVKISGQDSDAPDSSSLGLGVGAGRSTAQSGSTSSSFDASLASAISAELDPTAQFANLPPSSRIPMFPQGKSAKQPSWRDSVREVTGGIPIRTIGGGLEKARKELGRGVVGSAVAVNRRRKSSGSRSSNGREETSLSFDQDVDEEDENFAEAMKFGKGDKDSGISTSFSISPIKKDLHPSLNKRNGVAEFGSLEEEDGAGDFLEADEVDWNSARTHEDDLDVDGEAEGWDSLQDKQFGGKGRSKRSMMNTSSEERVDGQQTFDESSSSPPEEFTLGVFDEELQTTPKVSKPSKTSISSISSNIASSSLPRQLIYSNSRSNQSVTSHSVSPSSKVNGLSINKSSNSLLSKSLGTSPSPSTKSNQTEESSGSAGSVEESDGSGNETQSIKIGKKETCLDDRGRTVPGAMPTSTKKVESNSTKKKKKN